MLSLLIVDDESAVVDTLAYTIPWEQLEILTVHKAYSAKEAIAILSEHAVDLMIADIYMPGMSGIELAEYVRQHHRHIRCVLLSGHAEFEYAKQALTYGVSEYLLKPAADEEIIRVIRKLADQIREEWQEVVSRTRVVDTLRESLPVLKDKLLNEMLSGKLPEEGAEHVLELYDLPFRPGDDIRLMLIRMEESLPEYNQRDFFLLEYAILNIAAEMFGDAYDLWTCKDAYDHLVLLVRGRGEMQTGRGAEDKRAESKKFDLLALQLQRNIGVFLKRVVSIIVSKWGVFPGDIGSMYRQMIGQVRGRLANESGCFLPGDLPEESAAHQPLQPLYETPSLQHLLDSKQWGVYREKLSMVIALMKDMPHLSEEYVREAYTVISGSFYYYAHRHHQLLSDLVGGAGVLDRTVRSVQQLAEWAEYMLDKLEGSDQAEQRSAKEKLTMRIKDYVERNLDTASLQTIADAVYLHPVYLSRLYKAETGEAISEYIHKQRMERAAQLLRTPTIRIYEISESLGYRNAAYFSKVFREQYGMKPQDFRDQGMPVSNTAIEWKK